MSMNLVFLKYFYDMGRAKSVRKSASENFVSPAAISNGIRKLEAELGAELLKHGKNKIELTKEGILLLNACESIFSLVEDTKIKIRRDETEIKQEIRVGLTHGLNQEFWALFLQKFSVQYPHYIVHFKVGSPNQLKAWVQDKNIDFAITISRDKPQNYQYILIHTGFFKFISHPSYKPNTNDTSFILTQDWPEVVSFKKEYFRRFKKVPTLKYEVESWGTIKNLVMARHGVGIVPDYQLFQKSRSIVEYTFPLKLNSYQIVALFGKSTYLTEHQFELVDQFKNFILFLKGDQKHI
jgi:DNA-binding transcriptional LysR family regulator